MLVSHILCEARPPRGAYFVRDVLCIWRFTWPAVVHIATWHWDWTCTSSLFNNGMDSMSRTRLFILNLILANIIWYLLATHLHVFFPSMVCASQEHWPCGYLLHVFESYCFYDFLFDWPLRLWTIFFTSLIISMMQSCLQQEVFSFLFCDFINKYFYGWSIVFCIDVFLWISHFLRMFLLVVTNQQNDIFW